MEPTTSATATITCQTYSGSTLKGTSTTTKTLSFNSADITPTVSIATTDPEGYLSTYGRYVKGKSKLQVTVTSSTVGGATVASMSISANGSTYSSSPATTGVIYSTSNTSVSATITDTRSKTATATSTIQIYDYSAPKFTTFSAYRCDSDGTANDAGAYIRVNYAVSVTSLGSHNSNTLVIKYKKVSASTYTTHSTTTLTSYTASGNVHNIVADVNSSYNIQVSLTDDFTTATQTKNVPSAKSHVNHGAGVDGGIGIGMVSGNNKSVEISSDWDILLGNPSQVKGQLGLGGFEMVTNTAASNNGTTTFSVANGESGIIIATSATTNLHNIYTYNVSSSGSVAYINYRSSSNITVSVGTNSITFTNTNTGNTLKVRKIKL